MAFSVNTTPLLQDVDGEEQISDEFTKDNNHLLSHVDFKDRYNMGYIIFYLLGIATLLPWNFYVTANDYWMYKFRNVSDSNSSGMSFFSEYGKYTPLQTEFTSYLSLAGSVPNIIFLTFNTAITNRISLRKRVLTSLYSMLFLMLLTLVFVNVDTDNWQQGFFGFTLTCIVLLNGTYIVGSKPLRNNIFPKAVEDERQEKIAIFGGSIFGIIGKFSPVYITAVIGGQALGGIFAALAQIASLAIGASSTHSALVYFVIANLTITVTIICYVVLENSNFFKYHTLDEVNPSINQYDSDAVYSTSHTTILRKIWGYGFCLFICYTVTLSVCPGISVLIQSEGRGHQNKWNDIYFVPTINYLLSNTGDYIGRLAAVRIMKPKNLTLLNILSISRIIFIPLLLLCNAQPRQHLAVVFDQDYQYIIIIFFCLISNGYLTNLTTILVPKVVDHHEKEIASSMVAIFLGVGVTLGAGICLLLIHII